MDNGSRDEMLSRLAEAIGSVTIGHPTRVAVDGPPAAGKTTPADELAVVLRAKGHDNHDYDALTRVLLDPLGPGGDRRFQQAVYDRTTDTALSPPVTTASADAVLVFDGVFLMRPELIDRWDLRIFVSAAFEKTVDRALIREQGALSAADVERRWRERYIPSQRFYFATVRPADRADIVVHNDEPHRPAWETRTLS